MKPISRPYTGARGRRVVSSRTAAATWRAVAPLPHGRGLAGRARPRARPRPVACAG